MRHVHARAPVDPGAADHVGDLPGPVAVPGHEDDIRDLLADVSGLRRSVGFRIPEAELTCVVGIGARAVGSPARRSAPGRAAPVARVRRRAAHARSRTPGDLLLPHPRAPSGPVLRTRPAADRARLAGYAPVDRRGARLPLLRRARPARLRRRDREPGGRRGRGRARSDRRRGPGVRRRQLRHRAEVPARPHGLGRAARSRRRSARSAARSSRHRDGRRRQAARLAHRAQRDRGRGRRGAADRALQHAVRQGGRGRVRHLLHRLRPHPGR